jgi:hypothetical protein
MKIKYRSLLQIIGIIAALTMLSAPSYAGINVLATDAQYITPNGSDPAPNVNLVSTSIESNKRSFWRFPTAAIPASGTITNALLGLYVLQPGSATDGFTIDIYALQNNAQVTNAYVGGVPFSETTWVGSEMNKNNAPDGGMYGTASTLEQDPEIDPDILNNPFNDPASNDVCTLIGSYTFPAESVVDQYISIQLDLAAFQAVLDSDDNGEITLLTGAPAGTEAIVTSPFNTTDPLPVLYIEDGTGDSQAPASPQSFTLLRAKDAVVELEWGASPSFDVAYYVLYRSDLGSFFFADQIGTFTNKPFAYTDTDVVNGTTYDYYVTAIDLAGNESIEAEVQATPLEDLDPPLAPSGILAQPFNSQILLTWTAPPNDDVAGYRVYRDGIVVAEPTEAKYTDGDVVTGSNYTYEITAFDNSLNTNESVKSFPATVTATELVLPDIVNGFNPSTPEFPAETVWSVGTTSVSYRTQYAGFANVSLLKAYPLARTNGASYTLTCTIKMIDGYADDNNRLGMYFFGDFPSVAEVDGGLGEDEEGALSLIFNTDDSSTGGPPGNNKSDQIYWTIGSDYQKLVNQLRTQDAIPYAQDLFGTAMDFEVTMNFLSGSFTNNAPTNSPVYTDAIQLIGRMTDVAGDVTELEIIVPASVYTGDYFGFVNRSRVRNYVEGSEGTAQGRSRAWEMEYLDWSLVDNNAPTNAPGGFAQWAEDNGIALGPNGDDDGDGISNIKEYAFGGVPATSTEPTLPVFAKSGNGFTLVYPELADEAAGITYTVQYTTNLVTGPWVDLTPDSTTPGTPLNTVTVNVDAAQGEKFIRLKVE